MRNNHKPQHLYTVKDVEQERKRLYILQKGIDPILKREVLYKDTACDHDHTLQNTRGALHKQSNAFEGRVLNAYKRGLSWLTDVPLPDILRNLAEYLEQDYSENPLHPGWIKAVSSKFNTLSEKQKTAVLEALGETQGKNSTERKKLFAGVIKTKVHSYEELLKLVMQMKGTENATRDYD